MDFLAMYDAARQQAMLSGCPSEAQFDAEVAADLLPEEKALGGYYLVHAAYNVAENYGVARPRWRKAG